jgi:tetratricopeptide (TPR) repeat protein
MMRLLYFINLTYFCTCSAFCQDQKVIDSLENVLSHKIGAARYPVLHRLAIEYVDIDNDRAFSINQQAEEAALMSRDSLWILESQRLKGQVLFRLGRHVEIMTDLKPALSLAKRLQAKSEYMGLINSFGSAYLYQTQFDKALDCYFECYEIAKDEKDSTYLAISLNNIGTIYYKLKDYQKALDYLMRSWKIKQATNELTFNTPMNLSLCYSQLSDFQNANIYLQESIDVCGNDCPDQAMEHIEYASGFMLLGLNEYEKAQAEFAKSYAHSKMVKDYRMQLDNIYLLAEIYIRQNRIDKAMQFLEEGEAVITQGVPFNLEMIKIYSRFSELYLLLKKYNKASLYQAKYIRLKDSIYNEELMTSLMKTEAKYLEQENKATIAARDETILLKEEIIRRQTNLNIVTGLLVLITTALFIFVFRSFLQRKNLNAVLEKKIKERTLELELSSNRLFKVVIEKDLQIHRASQVLAATANTIEGLCKTATRDISDPIALSYLNRIDKAFSGLIGNIRSVFAYR